MLVKEEIFECPRCNEQLTSLFNSTSGWNVVCTKCDVVAKKVGVRVIETVIAG
jgi:transcription elongation factor Elf1